MILKKVITLLSKYQIAESKTFEKIKTKIDKKLYAKIEDPTIGFPTGFMRFLVYRVKLFWIIQIVLQKFALSTKNLIKL